MLMRRSPEVGQDPPVRRAALPLIVLALLVAVFPANLHMALHPEDYPQFPPAAEGAKRRWISQPSVPPDRTVSVWPELTTSPVLV